MGGVACTNIAKRAVGGTTWAPLSTGTDAIVYRLLVMPNDDLILAGSFTSAGGVTVYKIARWNGQGFDAMGLTSAPSSYVDHMALDTQGNLWATGDTYVLASRVSSAARFNGYSWSQGDFILPSGVLMQWLTSLNGQIWCGIGSAAATTMPCAVTTTVTNGGDVSAAPVVLLDRVAGTAAQVCTLINESTGDEMFFAYDLAAGETLTLDLRRGRTAVTSSYRGKAVGATPVPGSTLAGWALRPGANLVSSFVSETGSPTVTGAMYWQNGYLGIDVAA